MMQKANSTAPSLTSALDDIRQKLRAEAGPDDIRHLKKIQWAGWAMGIAGLSTAWIVPNLITAFLISSYRFTAWTMLAHHILHKGYDQVPGIPATLTSTKFARGWRRWIDWPDWIWPRAWMHEHNTLHHYHLGETADPDLVEENLQWLRDKPWPVWLKYILMFFMAGMWKYIYYAPNTLRTWLIDQYPERTIPAYGSFAFWQPFSFSGRRLWGYCYLPYLLVNFIMIPSAFLWISPRAALFVFLNMVLAEWITNFHTFLVIVTNHCGDDLPRFDQRLSGKEEFYVRQIAGSVNFNSGSGWTDFWHGYLNYQIEHHLWPDLTMLQYKKAQPLVQQVALAHNIPYVRQSVWVRLGKTLAIMAGTTSMQRSIKETSLSEARPFV